MKYIITALLLALSATALATNYKQPQPVKMEIDNNATAIAAAKSNSSSKSISGAVALGGAATAHSGDSTATNNLDNFGNSSVSNVNNVGVDLADAVTVEGDTLSTGDISNIIEGHSFRGGNQNVYMPRSLELMEAGRSSMSAQGNSVTMPTLGVIAQDVKSDGPYGDDRVYGLRLDIPITWGLPKRKDVIGAGISNQNAQTQMIIDDNNRQTQWAIQNMKEQAEDHALNVDLLCHQLHLAGRIRDSFGENHPCHGKDYKTVNHDRDVAEIGADRLPGH